MNTFLPSTADFATPVVNTQNQHIFPADAASMPAPRDKNANRWAAQTVQRDVVFAEFRPLVQRLIRKYGDTPEMRKDLEGEIYCIFCHLFDAFDPARGVPLKAYLVHQITTSTYTFARRHWGQVRREICMEVREDTTNDANPSRQWDNNLMMQQAQGKLAEAIAQLPLRQRQVVIWRYYEHCSFEEIAETLNVQTATTRSLLRHGMNSLRRIFEKADVAL